jgi:Putative prokaryotic signal transducing protein
MGDEALVTVRICNYLHEAELIKSVLDADGIDAEIPDAYMAGVQPALGAAIGGIRVVVHSSDLDRAQQALTAIAPAE